MMNIRNLARPEIVAMQPYVSARGSAAADGILLNANEAPQPLVDDPQWQRLALNRYHRRNRKNYATAWQGCMVLPIPMCL